MSQRKKVIESIVSYDAITAKAQYGEAVRLFLMDCRFRNLSPYTIEGYHVYLKSLQRDLEAWQLSLDTLTPKDLSVRMVNEMLDRALKPNTVNGKIRTLQQFFMGKGRKFRCVPIQSTCVQTLKHYLNERGEQPFDHLWITINQTPLARHTIINIVKNYINKAEIAGVDGACHVFRHTMAKMFLMNGGDIFTLQYLLGHANLEMTRYYVELFSTDLHKQHEKYSPIENLADEANFTESEVVKHGHADQTT